VIEQLSYKDMLSGVSPVLARTETDITMDYILSAHFNCYSCEAVITPVKAIQPSK